MAVVAGLWAVVGSFVVFPELSSNSDEGVYLLQAETLRSGRLAPVAPATESDAFVPWFSEDIGGRYVLKYTPVHAAVIAVGGATTGSPRTALAPIAGAQVVLLAALARELGLTRRSAAGAASIFALSPLSLLLSTTFLPYGTSLALGLGAATMALRSMRRDSMFAAAGAGLLIGVAGFARPYDAALWALVIVVALVHRAGRDRIVRLSGAALAGVAGPVIALLWFNSSVTGDALQLPFNLIEPLDRLGFGPRRALPADPLLDYTPARGFEALGRNLLLVLAWSGGGLVSAFFAVRSLARRQPGRRFIISLLVIWPLGYLLFWGSYLTSFLWDGALVFGPYYYLPMVAMLTIPAAVGLADLFERQRSLGLVAVAGMVILNAAILGPALAEHHDRSDNRIAVAATLDDLGPEPSLVFMPSLFGAYLQNPMSFLRNTPELDGPVVFALRRSAEADERVRTLYPDRKAYRLDLPNGWSDRGGADIEARLVPLG